MPDQELLAALQARNARLIAPLDSVELNGARRQRHLPSAAEPSSYRYDWREGRTPLLMLAGQIDVYPIRWESRHPTKSGYAPACRQWRAGVCEKPRIKCSDCGNRLLIPLSDAVIYGHLAGEHTVGVYPLLEDDSCYFVAVDFDEAEWREDARAFMQSCEALGVPRRSRFRAPAKALIPGYSLRVGFPPVTRGAWVRPSSATPARARASSS